MLRLIQHLKDEDLNLYKKLEQVIKSCEKIWEYPYLFWFTDHGTLHSQKVIEHIEDIIEPFWGDPNFLTPEEVYTLCASAYLHDVGMQYLKWENNGVLISINRLTKENYDAIRKKHAEKSFELIKQRLIKGDRDTLDLGLEDDNYLEAIALVCKGHSAEHFSDVIEMLDETPLTPSNKRFRSKLLAALLLFADELDLHNSRAEFSKVRLFNLDPLSQLHFFKHHCIEYIKVDKQQIVIQYKIHPNSQPYMGALKKLIEGKLLNQLETVQQIFRDESAGKISISTEINSKVSIDKFGAKREMSKEAISCLNEEVRNCTKGMDVAITDLTYHKLLDLSIRQHQIEIEAISAKYIKTLFVPRKGFDNHIKQFLKSLSDTRAYNNSIPLKNKKAEKQNEKTRKKNQETMQKYPAKTKKELTDNGMLLKEISLLKEKPVQNCLLLMGEAGIGKTNLLCYLTQKYGNDYPTVFLNGGRMVLNDHQNIEDIITEYFNKLSDMEFGHGLQVMEEIASKEGKSVLCFIDAINECLDLDLMRIYLGNILSYNKDKNIAFVISCRDIDWRFFENERAITECVYLAEKAMLQKGGATYLDLLSHDEFKDAWRLYKNHFKLDGEISYDIEKICRQPIMLRFLCEAYEGGKVPERDIRRIEIFNNYWDKKLAGTCEKRETQAFLFDLVDEMTSQKKAELIEIEVERVTKQKADKPHTTFRKVLSENIILYKEIDGRTKEYKIGFTYEAFFEYVIARHFLNTHSSLDDEALISEFKNLIDRVQSFRNLMGAIEYIIMLLEDADGEVYIRMLELLSTYKDKNIRHESVITIEKIKNVLKVKNVLKMLADDDNLKINKGVYGIFRENRQKFDTDFQRDILAILSTKSNKDFLRTPIESIIKSYNDLPHQIQELLIYFSQCEFINTKRRLISELVISTRELPSSIYCNIIFNLIEVNDRQIMKGILDSLSDNISIVEGMNMDSILDRLIKNKSIDLKELGKLLEDNANIISDTILKDYMDWCIEEGDEWLKINTVHIMSKLIEQESIVIDSDYSNLISKLINNYDEAVSHVAKRAFCS